MTSSVTFKKMKYEGRSVYLQGVGKNIDRNSSSMENSVVTTKEVYI